MSALGSLPFVFDDLSVFPAPAVLEPIQYEALLAERVAEYNGLSPLVLNADQLPVVLPAELVQGSGDSYWKIPLNAQAGLHYVDLDSDPVTRLLQADTYRELLLRNRINAAALATLPAFATDSDLDHIALRYWGLTRNVIQEADESAYPPLPEILESDDALRKRIILRPEQLAHGGPESWYLSAALDAHPLVKDAYVTSPSRTEITISILSHTGDGSADAELIAAVQTAVTGRHDKPLGDSVTVQSAVVVEYAIKAQVFFYDSALQSQVLDQMTVAWARYRAVSERIGHMITDSGVKAALHQSGVFRVLIDEGTQVLPVVVGSDQAPFNTGLTLVDENGDELL